MAQPEAWMRGRIEGIDPYLQPVAHSLIQAQEDVERIVDGLTAEQLWTTPGGSASIAFHVRHMFGALDRLFTYARGESLNAHQQAALAAEARPDPSLDGPALVQLARTGVERGFAQLRTTARDALLDRRTVGRRALPSTVLGLLFHAAEHLTRHAGQAATIRKVIEGPARS